MSKIARDYMAEVAPHVAAPKVFLSTGAGVQSSTVPFMCEAGVLPYKIDAGIFADTQAEPPAVYRWLEWLEKQVSFPIHRVTRGNLAVDSIRRRVSKKGRHYWQVQVPFFMAMEREGKVRCHRCGGSGVVTDEDTDAIFTGEPIREVPPRECPRCAGVGKIATGQTVNETGKLGRKCTAEYKIREIVKKCRALVGPGLVRTWARAYNVRRERAEVTVKERGKTIRKKVWRWIVPPGTPPLALSLIGISLDEIQRVKPSREPWIKNVHPLVDAGITRQDCLRWMREARASRTAAIGVRLLSLPLGCGVDSHEARGPGIVSDCCGI